jgi:hypothetical protein
MASSQTSIPAHLKPAILDAMPPHLRPDALVLWTYALFPFGMTLDYERKFVHYVGSAQDAGTQNPSPPPREDSL